MATSIGAAAAQGIESGFGLGLRMQDQQERTRRTQRDEQRQDEDRGLMLEERADQRARLAKQDERVAAQDKRVAGQDARQQRLDQMKLLDDDLGLLKSEGENLLKQYGGYDKIPAELRDDYTQRTRTKRGERNTLRGEFFQPSVQDAKKDAAEKWSRIQAGQMSVDDLSDDDLVKTLTVQTRRNLNDFLEGPEGQPSVVRQGALDFEAGVETGNQDLMLKGINVLLAPELETGIGQDGPDGNEIVAKEIVELVPHPEDPSRVVPIVKVTVRRDDGAVGSYMAPITENRSSDPNDNVKTISLEEGFERVGQLTTLGAALNRPDARKRIEAGQKKAGGQADEFLQQLYGIGGTMPKRKVKRENVNLGGTMLVRTSDAESGEIIGEERMPVTAKPKARGEGDGGGAGKPPAGYRFKANGDLEAIPGGPAFAKAESKSEKERAGQNAAIAQADRLISTIDSALKKVGMNTAGLGGAVLGKLPGSEAKDMASELETVKANLGFAELQAMREASPTGGALGAIAVQELVALQSTVASLDQKQSPDQLRKSLNKIREHYQAWRETVVKSGQEGGGVEAPPAGQPAGASGEWGGDAPQIAVNPKTGERLMLKGGQWVPVQ